MIKQIQRNKRKRKIKLTQKLEGKRKRLSGNTKKNMLGMVIRGDGDGDSGIVMDVIGEERLFRVAFEPWGKNYNEMTEDEVCRRSTNDRIDVPDFTRLGREVEVQVVGGELVKGIICGYNLDNEDYQIKFEKDVIRTWEIPRTERQIPWEVMRQYWTMKGESVDALLNSRSFSFRELTPAAGQVPGSSRQGEAS